MIHEDRTREIFDAALKQTAKDAQLLLYGGKEQLARIGKNYVYQNMLTKEYGLKIQIANGKKVGSASCNRFSGEELSKAMEQAEQIAIHQKEDPDWVGFLEGEEPTVDKQFYEEKTMEISFEQKLQELPEIFEDARSKGIEIAGAFSHGDSIQAIANKKGMFHYQTYTDSSFTFSIMTPKGGTGWSEFHSHDIRNILPSELYRISLQKALASENPAPLEEGEYTVILEPPAVGSLMLFLGYLGFGGTKYREGRSYFSGKIGQKLLGENLTITDDWTLAQSFGCPFDFEGTKRQKLTIIENGVFKTPVLDHLNAAKLKMKTTGHALPYPSSTGPLPLNLSIAPGSKNLEEMIAGTKKGILVTRFFYDNVIDPGKLTLTGMTRDGTFLIEDGKIVRGLKNLRYNEALPRVFNHVSEISNQLWSLRDFGRMALPALKVEGFKFTGSTL